MDEFWCCNYQSHQPFFGSPVCKIQFHPWLSSQPAICLPGILSHSLSCLSLRLCTLMLLSAYHYWKAAGTISVLLITWALHGCMIYRTLHGGSVLMSEAWYGWLWGLLVILEVAEGNLLSEWSAVHPGRTLGGCVCMWGHACKCVCVNGCVWIAKGLKGRYYTVCGCVFIIWP